jgi:hypothetical protein
MTNEVPVGLAFMKAAKMNSGSWIALDLPVVQSGLRNLDHDIVIKGALE